MKGEFEYPIVNTIKLLKRQHNDLLLLNADKSRVAIAGAGNSIEVFDFNISSVGILQANQVVSSTEYYLKLLANAYKWFNDSDLEYYLTNVATDLQKKSLGYQVLDEMIPHFVSEAIYLKDTMEVRPNRSIRFLKNPYYQKNPGEYNIESVNINQVIGQERRDATYTLIKETIEDYDLSKQTLSKTRLGELTGRDRKTIQRYFNQCPELEEIYEAIKSHSGTREQQLFRKKYERNKVA